MLTESHSGGNIVSFPFKKPFTESFTGNVPLESSKGSYTTPDSAKFVPSLFVVIVPRLIGEGECNTEIRLGRIPWISWGWSPAGGDRTGTSGGDTQRAEQTRTTQSAGNKHGAQIGRASCRERV